MKTVDDTHKGPNCPFCKSRAAHPWQKLPGFLPWICVLLLLHSRKGHPDRSSHKEQQQRARVAQGKDVAEVFFHVSHKFSRFSSLTHLLLSKYCALRSFYIRAKFHGPRSQVDQRYTKPRTLGGCQCVCGCVCVSWGIY